MSSQLIGSSLAQKHTNSHCWCRPSLSQTQTQCLAFFFFFFFAHILRSNRAESQRGFAAEGKTHTFHLQFSLAGYRQGFDLLP